MPIITASSWVDIHQPPETVFALLSDPPRRARVNPNLEMIRVEVEGGGILREGAVVYHRAKKGTRIFEYQMRCLRFEPPRLIETGSLSQPEFGVTMRLEPISSGTRLYHEERMHLPSSHLGDSGADLGIANEGMIGQIFRALTFLPPWNLIRGYWEEKSIRRMKGIMLKEIDNWLLALKKHLEGITPEL